MAVVPTGRDEAMMEMMGRAATTVASEFSDLGDIADVTRVVVRLVVAGGLGGVLGMEREWSGKSAGLRTHMLVAIGSAVFVMIPQMADMSTDDTTRVMGGVITGVGFLGGGAIMKRETIGDVTGLTTAAGIWMTAAIGMAAGVGHGATAVLSTALALATLLVVPLIADRIFRRASPRGRKSAP